MANARTGIEAARIVEDYLNLRGFYNAGDAANIIHILNEEGFLRHSGQDAELERLKTQLKEARDLARHLEVKAWGYLQEVGNQATRAQKAEAALAAALGE